MGTITDADLEYLMAKPRVRKNAVSGFLGSSGNDPYAFDNLALDAKLYNWNAPTVNAIRQGLMKIIYDRPIKKKKKKVK